MAQERTNAKTLVTMSISLDDLKVIREDIAATVRPRWHAAPPPNLGQVSHGKLKADEWRSCFEFDIPVSLPACNCDSLGNLKTLKELQPTKRLRPNHINALLVGDYLRLYGPVRGWWMFPFERVIGDQNEGQMEKTMFTTFTAKSFMHAT